MRLKDKTGEEKVNNFGSKMVIKEYRGAWDIDVYFPEYNWVAKHINYSNFKKGNIKCPYEPRTYGVGYLGEGKYKTRENGKLTYEYKIYYSMIQRCYDPKYQEKEPTYKGCTIEDYLLNFQHMGEWINNNYYEVPGEKMHLDKDILCKGNKTYSRDTCIFVPQIINKLFTKRDNDRGDCPIGVTPSSSGNYQVYCSSGYGKSVYLGTYLIKETIDSYEGKIPEPFYSRLKTAMYDYEIEINN